MNQKCILHSYSNAQLEAWKVAEKERGIAEQHRMDSSPLRRALRKHFESYGGLTEPRIEIANIALRPQVDDL